jgi:hypothetical protein
VTGSQRVITILKYLDKRRIDRAEDYKLRRKAIVADTEIITLAIHTDLVGRFQKQVSKFYANITPDRVSIIYNGSC